jgi:hypothetical protein
VLHFGQAFNAYNADRELVDFLHIRFTQLALERDWYVYEVVELATLD